MPSSEDDGQQSHVCLMEEQTSTQRCHQIENCTTTMTAHGTGMWLQPLGYEMGIHHHVKFLDNRSLFTLM